MWQIIWEFRVAQENRKTFEEVYGSGGEWATLFENSTDFRGTTLLRDPVVAGRYLTIDTWTSAEAFDRFHKSFAAEYKARDLRCEALTEYEMKIGAFETVAKD